MKPSRQFVLNLIIALCFAFTLFIAVLLLAESRDSAARTEKLSEDIKAQTDINQRYLRCILLIEREKFQSPETRVDAIDKCAIESRTPDGISSGNQPTTEQRQDFEDQPVQENPTSRTSQPPQTSGPESEATAPEQPKSEPSLLERTTKPIRDFVNSL